MRFATPRRVALCLLVFVLVSCARPRRKTPPPPAAVAPAVAPAPAPERTCSERIAAVEARPGLAGAPSLERERVSLLVSAKAEPVVFVRSPARAADAALAESLRQRLEKSSHPWELLRRYLPTFAQDPRLGRAVLLREGHLYAERAELGWALVELVQLHHLFREREVWVQRGESTRWAERGADGRYFWGDGRPVRLLLFDRLGTGAPDAPLFRDLRALAHRLHFSQARVRHLDGEYLVAELRYGRDWVPSLLRADGAHLELECESIAAPERSAEARRHAAVQVLRRVMLEQVDEGTLFDEPMTEVGQQDGRLRPPWRHAYLAGRDSFRFDHGRYPVFDPSGRPIPPQICIDFLLDTLQRASGTWWQRRGQPRQRVVGLLDLERAGLDALRPAEHFLAFAEQQRDWFEVKRYSAREQFPIGERARLAQHLLAAPDDYRAGDIVLIRGWTPWDRREMHYHSFFVYETDPVSGIPIVIAGNAGRPSLRTWRVESTRTPERLFVARIRPRLEWLERVIPAGASAAPVPPPLSAEAARLPVVILHPR